MRYLKPGQWKRYRRINTIRKVAQSRIHYYGHALHMDNRIPLGEEK
jgi:hypothetical protein